MSNAAARCLQRSTASCRRSSWTLAPQVAALAREATLRPSMLHPRRTRRRRSHVARRHTAYSPDTRATSATALTAPATYTEADTPGEYVLQWTPSNAWFWHCKSCCHRAATLAPCVRATPHSRCNGGGTWFQQRHCSPGVASVAMHLGDAGALPAVTLGGNTCDASCSTRTPHCRMCLVSVSQEDATSGPNIERYGPARLSPSHASRMTTPHV